MEQRPLRLGDIVDDYCTRERRVTNHVIVALVENVIRQTRCTTCDSEHAYKGAREPRLRKKPAETLYDQVLAGVSGADQAPNGAAQPERAAAAADGSEIAGDAPASDAGSSTDGTGAALDESPAVNLNDEPPIADAWLAQRRLIRATLPRTENEPPVPRPIPEFTMHQRPPSRGGRGFRFRGHGGGQANGDGNGPSSNGFGHGNRPGNGDGRPGRHRGRKRR